MFIVTFLKYVHMDRYTYLILYNLSYMTSTSQSATKVLSYLLIVISICLY